MQELNAAWEVLRNPASRAAYDRSLRGETVGVRTRGVGAADADDPHAGAAVLVPDLGRQPSTLPTTGLPWGCLGGVAAAIVVAMVLLAVVAGGGERPPVDVLTREPLGVGSCVVIDQGIGRSTTVLEVSCGGPHTGVVVERTVFPKPCPLGTVAVLLDDQRTLVCVDRRGG